MRNPVDVVHLCSKHHLTVLKSNKKDNVPAKSTPMVIITGQTQEEEAEDVPVKEHHLFQWMNS